MIDFDKVQANRLAVPFQRDYMGELCQQLFLGNIGTDGQRAALKRILEQLHVEQEKFTKTPEIAAINRFRSNLE